jgi:hypothetical protein
VSGGAPFAAGSETSEAAAESVSSESGRIRRRVFALLLASGAEGLTCDEVEQREGMRHQTTSPRIWELVRQGLVLDSGRKRKTRSGRGAVVWIAAAGVAANDPRIDASPPKLQGAPRSLPADPALARDNERLRAQVAVLRAALARFAAGYDPARAPVDIAMLHGRIEANGESWVVTYGDLRRAREAMQETEGAGEGAREGDG